MEQARPQQENLQKNPEVTTGITTIDLKPTATPARSTYKLTPGRNVSMFFGWAAAGAAIVVLLWWVKPDRAPDDMSLMGLGTDEIVQTRQAAGLPSNTAEVKPPSDNSADPDEDVERLTDSITYLESKLISTGEITDAVIGAEQKPASSTSPAQTVTTEAAQELESLPPAVVAGHLGREAPAPGSMGSDTVADEQTSSPKPLSTVVSKDPVTERQDSATREQPSVSVDKAGPWVVNLASTSSKANADRLSKKARSMAIQTEQQPVTVKGKQYWRVQISGFSTKEEARAYADTASEKLGLKDVWILTR